MDALRVLADDLTGACDVGAELLPWRGGVAVVWAGEGGGTPPPQALAVRNTQSRTLAPALAAARVHAALAPAGGFGGIVLKKIDTGLRGVLGAELDAAMDALGAGEAFVLPAIPEVGRTTEGGRQMIAGVPVHETPFARDPQNPIHDASVCAVLAATSRRAAAVLDLAAVRAPEGPAAAIAGLRADGAVVIVCDAQTEGDLERTVRVLLGRPRPLLLAGSIGLARALRRVLGQEPVGQPRATGPAPAGAGVLCVMGSAHPTAHAQVAWRSSAASCARSRCPPARPSRPATAPRGWCATGMRSHWSRPWCARRRATASSL
ncbi:MAG: four-carbon acid sugar kinase family protein [bacterium]|nr:four-carbon acid sugar kinase family protein [bacterium]